MTPEDVLSMPLPKFEATFGFQPDDALEKAWFAVNAKRLSAEARALIPIFGFQFDASKVVMK